MRLHSTPRIPPRRSVAGFFRRLALGWLAGNLLSQAPAQAGITAEAMAQTVKQQRDSVLFFGGAIKYRCGRCSNDHDLRVLSTAVVVDRTGLFLASQLGPLLDPKSEVRESHLHVVAADGVEVPVRLTVTDNELGVLVLSLEKPEDAKTHAFAPLTLDAPPAARLLDELVVLRRFDQRVGYAVQAFTVRVNAIEERPRRTYFSPDFPQQELTMAPGFNATGQLVGLYTGGENLLAADEFAELVGQALRKQNRDTQKP